MADYATKQDVQEIVDKAVGKAVTDLSEVIEQIASNDDGRFNKVEADITDMKEDIADLNKKYDRLLDTIDAFIKRIDDNETENAARDSQLARLERWIEQIAKETGVKLQY